MVLPDSIVMERSFTTISPRAARFAVLALLVVLTRTNGQGDSGVGRCFCMEGLHSIMRALSYRTQCCQLLWVSPGYFVYALED